MKERQAVPRELGKGYRKKTKKERGRAPCLNTRLKLELKLPRFGGQLRS
jgi:hypothetical protein